MSMNPFRSAMDCDADVCRRSARLRLWPFGGRLRRRMIRAMIGRMQRDTHATFVARHGTERRRAELHAELIGVCRDQVGSPVVLLLIQVVLPILVRLFLEWWLRDGGD